MSERTGAGGHGAKPHGKPATVGVHAGQALPQSSTPPIDVPIYPSTTFRIPNRKAVLAYNRGGDETLYEYGRAENPTVRAVEQALAAIEGAEACLAFGSGMAAISTAALALVTPPDFARPLLCSTSIYGGTYRLLHGLFAAWKLPVIFAPPEVIASGDWPVHPCAVYVECPTNPTTRIADLALLARHAKEVDAVSVVDSTFAPPVLQRPIDLGIDLVIHSASKYLAGHHDVLAGAVLGSRRLIHRIEPLRRLLGGVLAPALASSLGRSLKTLELRVMRESDTALALARRLERHPAVNAVHYPGLESHPDHALAERQMRAYGGVLTLELAGGEAAAEKFYDRLALFTRAASLGGVESLVSMPIDTSHAGYDDDELARCGVTRSMVRLSIGVEDVDDLWADLEQALAE